MQVEVYDDQLEETTATLGDFRSLSVVGELYVPSRVELQVSDTLPDIGRLRPRYDVHGNVKSPDGAVYYVIDGRPYLVEDEEWDSDTGRWTFRGHDAAMLDRRLVMPPDQSSHQVEEGEATLRMREFVEAQAVDPDEADWAVPHLVANVPAAAGTDAKTSGRFDNLAELLAKIGEPDGIGWDVVFDPAGPEFRWVPIVGDDLTGEVVLSLDLQTASRFRWWHDWREQPTWVVVAGQDEAENRTVRVYGPDGSPPAASGLFARVVFQDARDTDDEDTHEERARALLHDPGPRVEVDVSSVTLRSDTLGRPVQLGDVVTAASATLGLELPVRVVADAVTVSSDGYSRKLSLGRRFPPGLGRDRDPKSPPAVERT